MQLDDNFVISGMLPTRSTSTILQANGVGTEKSPEVAVSIDDIFKLCQSSSKPSPMLPMERWTTMAVKDECFPLLAKRLMQDVGVGVEASSSGASDNDAIQPEAVGAGETIAIDVVLEVRADGQRSGVLQGGQTMSNGCHTVSRTRSNKRSGLVAKTSKSRRQKRPLIHDSLPLAMPD